MLLKIVRKKPKNFLFHSNYMMILPASYISTYVPKVHTYLSNITFLIYALMYISKYLLIDFVFFIVGLGLGGSVSFPKVADLESIYCQLLYSRDQTFVPLVETNTDEFLCTYKTHCFALCHCCEYDACDCEMTCPDNCTCYHDNSWSKNIAECSGKLIFSSTYSSNFCSLLILI